MQKNFLLIFARSGKYAVFDLKKTDFYDMIFLFQTGVTYRFLRQPEPKEKSDSDTIQKGG